MSTRSVIAEPAGDGWHGRYHHWDGYPSGLGQMLWELYHGHYAGNLDAMVTRLITNAPAGWSTINGADFTFPNYVQPDRNLEPCSTCGKPCWLHYGQYYRNEMYNVDGLPLANPDQVQQLDHAFESRTDAPHGPEAYGDREGFWIDSQGDDCGTEWAYVLCPTFLLVLERRFGQPGTDLGHGTGMFGMGASDTETGGFWAKVAEIPWTDEMTSKDWDHMDR